MEFMEATNNTAASNSEIKHSIKVKQALSDRTKYFVEFAEGTRSRLDTVRRVAADDALWKMAGRHRQFA
jgi:hypothetical protein